MVKTFEIDLDDALVENASEIFEALGTDIDSAIKIFLTQATLRQGFPFEVVIPNEETENGKLKTENFDGESESAEAEVVPVVAEEPVVESENLVNESADISAAETEPELSEESISEPSLDDLHGGITEDEEMAAATVSAVSEPQIVESKEEPTSEAGEVSEEPEIEESEESEVPTEPKIEESEESAVPPIPPEVAARVAANEALIAQMRQEIGDKAVTPEFDENEDDGTENGKTVESEPVIEGNASAESENPLAPEESSDEDEEEDETTPDNLFDAWDVGEEEDIGCR